MRSSILSLSTLTFLAAAAPHPQDIAFDEIPSYTVESIPLDLASQVVPYNPTSAIVAAAADVTANPLPQRRGLETLKARAACEPQPISSNTYNVDLSSADTFRSDGNIASAANSAPNPSGYYRSFQNLKRATSAYAYLGFNTVASYNPALCSARCTTIAGCISFNIYFERDPTLEPGPGCLNPTATVNIKCSYWGAPIDNTTALNGGQCRRNFEVAIAGSNGYTTSSHQMILGYHAPTFLGTAAVNAPVDCNGKDTYMGHKLFNDGPFDPRLCSAACDAQSAYNLRHPPTDGSTPKICRFFNTYILNKNGVGQGQYCSLYTQAWSQVYATNKGQTRGSDKYTISYSFAYTNSTDDGTSVCSGDGPFCSSFINYLPSTSTVVVTSTLAPAVTTQVVTSVNTTTVYTATVTVTAQGMRMKRQELTHAEHSIAIQTHDVIAAGKPTPPPARLARHRRALPTPSNLSGLSASGVSSLCSSIATGVVTLTSTSTATVALSTVITNEFSTTTIYTASTFTIPAVILSSPTAIVGSLNGSPGNYDDSFYSLTLPFPIGGFGTYSTQVYLMINGMVSLVDGTSTYTNTDLPSSAIPDITLLGFWDDLYIYAGTQQGIYYQIEGAVGNRSLLFEFYTSAYQRPTEYFHFTMGFFEARPGVAVYKYYDISFNGNSSTVGAQKRSANQVIKYSFNQPKIHPGLVLTVDTNAGTITEGSFTP